MRSLRIILILAAVRLRVLSRMRAIVAVLLLPGIVLYTVFTLIFSGPAGRPFRVAVVDQDQTVASGKLIEMLEANNVVVVRTENEDAAAPLLTAESAKELIRKRGVFRVAVVIPEGYATAPDMLSSSLHKGVDMYFDETQPMEAKIVTGILQMAAGRALFERFGAKLNLDHSSDGRKPDSTTEPERMLIKVNQKGVSIRRMTIDAKHTFLAGIVPMFILFGGIGAARSLLDALRDGEIRRLLAAPVRPHHVLLGQMSSALVVAMIQCYSMYVYAWLVFGVAIWAIAGGLVVLTLATCMATTAFGMFLAAFCRTSEQLDAFGTMIILAMSAIGGSMVPRFVMPHYMQPFGMFTINGWSYDGFIALIRNEGFTGIMVPCLVLVGIATACAVAGSILLTRRLTQQPVP
jgi:ABC-2 type transport system permease protein